MRRWNSASDLSSKSMGEPVSVRRSRRRAGFGGWETRLGCERAGGSNGSTLDEEDEGRGGVAGASVPRELDTVALSNNKDGVADSGSEELSSAIFSESKLCVLCDRGVNDAASGLFVLLSPAAVMG
jgi:hypothetical protein